jgi:hypothetical protein
MENVRERIAEHNRQTEKAKESPSKPDDPRSSHEVKETTNVLFVPFNETQELASKIGKAKEIMRGLLDDSRCPMISLVVDFRDLRGYR